MHQISLQNELICYHCIIVNINKLAKLWNLIYVISAVNFNRSRGVNNRQFKAFLDEIESEYGDIMYFCEVLHRFLSLLEEIRVFLLEKENRPVIQKMQVGYVICQS